VLFKTISWDIEHVTNFHKMSKYCREVPHYIALYFNRLTKHGNGGNGQRKTDVAVGPCQEKC